MIRKFIIELNDELKWYKHDVEKLKIVYGAEEYPTGSWVVVDDPNKTICCGTDFQCTNCKNVVDDLPTCMSEPLFKYCPFCGAYIRGDNKI